LRLWTSAWLMISVQFHTFNLVVREFLCWSDKRSHHMATMFVCKRNLFAEFVIELCRILAVVYHIHCCFAFALCWVFSVPKSPVSNTVFWILEMFLCSYKNMGRHIMNWAISYHIIISYCIVSYHISYHILYHISYHLFAFCGSVQDYKIHMDMEIVIFV